MPFDGLYAEMATMRHRSDVGLARKPNGLLDRNVVKEVFFERLLCFYQEMQYTILHKKAIYSSIRITWTKLV
jgi:hypothetical protein